MNNQAALINDRLFEKGIRDALAGLTTGVTLTKNSLFGQGTVVIRADILHGGRRLYAQATVPEDALAMGDGHFRLGKATGFELAHQLLETICEEQPQEITLSIKDISKARDKDNRAARADQYWKAEQYEHFGL